MNCRTHEHRHFERILRVCSCSRPTLVSGSVLHPSDSLCLFTFCLHCLVFGCQIKARLKCGLQPATGARQAFDAQGLPASCVLYCFLCPGLCRFSCPGGLLVQLLIASAKPKLGPEIGLDSVFANLNHLST